MVVLLHGYGAEAWDLAGVAEHLPVPGAFRFVLLAAPVELGEGRRAWWNLDLEARNKALAEGTPRDLSGDEPESLIASRKKLAASLAALRARVDVDGEAIAIVGFSQGAMAATDLAFHAEPPVQALGVLAGTVIAEDTWRVRQQYYRGIPAFVAHAEGRRPSVRRGGEARRTPPGGVLRRPLRPVRWGPPHPAGDSPGPRGVSGRGVRNPRGPPSGARRGDAGYSARSVASSALKGSSDPSTRALGPVSLKKTGPVGPLTIAPRRRQLSWGLGPSR